MTKTLLALISIIFITGSIGCNNPSMPRISGIDGDDSAEIAVEEPAPNLVEAPAGNGTLEDFGWTGTTYSVADGEFVYTGDYSVPAVFDAPEFSVNTDVGTKVVMEMDFNLDMAASELNSLKGERVKFWFDFGDIQVLYKARIPSDTGNKHIRINDTDLTEFTGYMSSVQTWYSLRLEVFADGTVELYLDDVLIITESTSAVTFESLSFTYRALTKSGYLPQIKFRNISVVEAAL